MLARLRRLTAPRFSDEGRTHQEFVLKIVLVSTPILLGLYLLIDWAIIVPSRGSLAFGNFLWPPMLLVLGFYFWLAQRGHIKLASYLFLGTLTAVTWLTMYALGTKDISILLFAFGISLSGILVGLHGAIAITAADALVFGALAWAEHHGLRPPPVATTLPVDVIAFALIMAALIVVEWLFRFERERLLQRYREQTSALSRANQALEEANQTLAQQKAWQHELSLAREIQASLLPKTTPNLPDFDIEGRSLAAEEVGGDFYTYLPLSGARLGLAVGDVSGKGMASAFYMAIASSIVEAEAPHSPNTASLMEHINDLLYRRMHETGMNAALLYGLLDATRRKLHVSNAGLIAPIVCHNGSIRQMDCVGLPLGAVAGETYQERSIEIQPGDVILFMSDGIVETMNKNRDLYGFARLEATLQSCEAKDAKGILNSVFDSAFTFMGDMSPQDDMTLVVIKMRDR